jgi:hypothetical protein
MKTQLDFFQRATLFSIAVVGLIFLLVDYAQFSPLTFFPDWNEKKAFDYRLLVYAKSNILNVIIGLCSLIGAIILAFKISKSTWIVTSMAFASIVLKQFYSFYLIITNTVFIEIDNTIIFYFTVGLMVVILIVLSLLLNFLLSIQMREIYL